MSTSPKTREPREDRAEPAEFAAFLVGHLNGRVHATISDEFSALLTAVSEHGRKGALVIKVNVEPSKGHVEGDPLAISVETALKAPKSVPPAAIYFVDDDGRPTRNDPRQMALEFRTAPTTNEFKDA
ncbi:hypothetical protein RM780_07695 [Streptomyces sp. DSM 44917]|uniref:Uncharacterized protein n=1 Tax=Streptomyces boetiae TaxID=3075541 RepID=A0ABU2L5K8_9ACTN|nr:hypothetical protein [Streptomyces sp. DSM 44917]MDT0306845.1 hypothetical protein [Streptomyces sp. DSM 44917]